MPPRARRRIAILGDGPAGTTLATLLARAGIECTLFSSGNRPPLLVGESLVPAVVPILRRLGVEEQVAAYGEHKPGASFTIAPDRAVHFDFSDSAGRTPSYAYNVPRHRFDRTLLEAARAAGATIVEAAGRVVKVQGDRLGLDTESVQALGNVQPDWIVDATGRSRSVSRMLALPTRAGERRDVALFAHLRGVPLDRAGHVHTDRLSEGWSWRIPLQDRVSVGVVARKECLTRFGSKAEEQFEGMLRNEPSLKTLMQGCERLTPVMRYDNYQLVTERGVGENWALVGDAFGFVDPVFSSGLYLAMESAEQLADALRDGRAAALTRYELRVRRHIEAWQRVAGYYYDGRIAAVFELGNQAAESRLGRLIHPHIARQLTQVLTGVGVIRRYPSLLLDFMVKYALAGREPEQYEVR